MTLHLPDELETEIEAAAEANGISRDAYVNQALAEYMFLKRFRSLRERLLAASPREYTDEEIFELVS